MAVPGKAGGVLSEYIRVVAGLKTQEPVGRRPEMVRNPKGVLAALVFVFLGKFNIFPLQKNF